LAVKDFFGDQKYCLKNNFELFNFQFDSHFDLSKEDLSQAEIKVIEQKFGKEKVNWLEYFDKNNIANSSDCIIMSKPIFLDNRTKAFIYRPHLGSEFYDLYSFTNGKWVHKKSLMTVLN